MKRLRIDETFRILGSIMVVLGWFIVLNISSAIGGAMSGLGDLLAVPYFIRAKAWDVVVMFVLLHSFTIHRLAQGLIAA